MNKFILKLLTFIIFIASSFSSFATYESGLNNPSQTWTFWDYYHMGGTSTNVYIDPTAMLYVDGFNGAVNSWGFLNISISSSSAATGRLNTVYEPQAAFTAQTIHSGNSSTKHVTSWAISANTAKIGTTASSQSITFAHEIGHVYGLNHCRDDLNTQIMYKNYRSDKSVKQNDLNGMYFCTHACNHASDSSFNYTYRSTSQHNKTCRTCLGYYLEIHLGVPCYKCAF